MAIYTIQAPDGRSFDLEGDSPPTEQELESVFASLPQTQRQLKPSTQATLTAEQNARQQIIQRAQRGPGEKIVSGIGPALEAVVSPVVSIVKGLGGIPELVAEPSRIPSTALESGRRTGIDILGLGRMVQPQITQKPLSETNLSDVLEAALGPAGTVGRQVLSGISNLRSRTPTEQEIQKELSDRPFQEAISQERSNVAFQGAQPEVAEALTQITELAPPVKGLQLLKSGGKGLAAIPRNIRTAIKPAKAKIGVQIEKAAGEEMSDIFHRNPNADKAFDTPIEGFANEVQTSLRETGDRLSELRALSGTTLNAGDQLASKIDDLSVKLQKQGQPQSVIQEVRGRANDVRGQLSDLNSLQGAVTQANRKTNILRPKTTADEFVDEIISKEGGSLINKELDSISGPEGSAIRKKWSNLKVLNDNVQERANKIINSAPPEAQSAVAGALTSVEGVAGLFALVQGYAGGVIPIASATVKKWAQKEAKDLKNSNKIIERTYETLRKTPPAVRPPLSRTPPPPIPQALEQAIGTSLTEQELLNQAIAQQLGGGSRVPRVILPQG